MFIVEVDEPNGHNIYVLNLSTIVPSPDPDPPGSEIICFQGSGSEITNFRSGILVIMSL